MKSNEIELKLTTNEIEIIPILENLLIDEGFIVQRDNEIPNDTMGIDPNILTIIIPAITAAFSGLGSVLKIIAQNRNVEYIIEDKKSKRSFSYRSQSGKKLSEEELSDLLKKVFLDNEDEG